MHNRHGKSMAGLAMAMAISFGMDFGRRPGTSGLVILDELGDWDTPSRKDRDALIPGLEEREERERQLMRNQQTRNQRAQQSKHNRYLMNRTRLDMAEHYVSEKSLSKRAKRRLKGKARG